MLPIPPQVHKVITRLNAAGYEAWPVGGCVRDALLGLSPNDWDITTSATPDAVSALFADHRVIETGMKHGTVTVLNDGLSLEITTYRAQNGAFANALIDDLRHRDFTINAMACTLEGEIIDPLNGQSDLSARVIRGVADPAQRFSEDGLRVLRALRFASKLGFTVEPKTVQAARECAPLLTGVAPERVRVELTKLLTGSNARQVMDAYADILCVVLPELKPTIGFEQQNPHHCYDVWQHTLHVVENAPATPILRWAALLHDIGKPHCFTVDGKGIGHFYGHAAKSKSLASKILHRLRFDNATKERVLLLVAHHDTPIEPNLKTVRRYLNRFGADALAQLLMLGRADNMGQDPAYRSRQTTFDALEQLLTQAVAEQARFSLSSLALDGNDLFALGYRGKQIGDGLAFLLEAVIDERCENNRDALIALLKTVFPIA